MTNPAILWSYRFDSQPVLRASVDSTPEDLTLATTAGTDYYVSGDGSATDLLQLLEDAIAAHSVAPAVSVALTSAHVVEITAGDTVQLLWSHVNTTLDPEVYGWTSSDTSAATTLTAPAEPGGLWRPGKPAEEDTGDQQPVVGGVTVSLSGLQRTSHFAQPYATRDVRFGLVLPERAEAQWAVSTAPAGAYETGWLAALSYGWPLQLCPDEDDLTTSVEYVLRNPTERTVQRDQRFPAQRYEVLLSLRRTS